MAFLQCGRQLLPDRNDMIKHLTGNGLSYKYYRSWTLCMGQEMNEFDSYSYNGRNFVQ